MGMKPACPKCGAKLRRVERYGGIAVAVFACGYRLNIDNPQDSWESTRCKEVHGK